MGNLGIPQAGLPFIPCPESLVIPVVPINPGDDLVVTLWDAYPGALVVGIVRILTPGGPIATVNFDCASGGVGIPAVKHVALPPGYLLDATLVTDSAPKGMVFAELALELVSALGDERAKHTVLAAGYITAGVHLAWPGSGVTSPLDGPGYLQSLTGTDPAAGVEISYTIPAMTRFLLRGVQFTLVTSVAVATRQVHLVIDDGATTLLDFPSSTTQTASLTKTYYWAPYAYNPGAVLNNIYNPIPLGLCLFAGWRVRTVTDAKDAGDNFGAPQFYVERWVEPSS